MTICPYSWRLCSGESFLSPEVHGCPHAHMLHMQGSMLASQIGSRSNGHKPICQKLTKGISMLKASSHKIQATWNCFGICLGVLIFFFAVLSKRIFRK